MFFVLLVVKKRVRSMIARPIVIYTPFKLFVSTDFGKEE